MKKIFISIGIVLALLVGGFFVLNSYIYNEKQADEEIPQKQTPTNEKQANEELTQEQRETLVSVYINENISPLSPEPEVLGGTFYVTNITFTDTNKGVVEYEDGHIALVADFEYFIDEGSVVRVDLTNARDFQP